ncbi:cytochrome c [Roseibium sp. RKSG952]|uniref:c-type cytochrome n=1 Tax=Roseibium sp. RKSG952 TaxID=2529384 RepID=UPI0012BC8AD0|nr:cytochrome c [Roseibium sp. RKSG952]MTH97954.1 cytochrome c [Roseibium sp. RKSG952]
MRKMPLVLGAGLALSVTLAGYAATAADDPIKTRQAIMSSVGAAAGLGGGMMKGNVDYSPAAAKAAIAAMYAASLSFGSFFPEGSETGENTEAAPAIWSDPEGFQSQIVKFQGAAAEAMNASGRNGPDGVQAFKAAFAPVLSTCKSCHEGYRTKK